MISKLFAFLCRFPILKRLLWRRWYQFLASRYRVPEWQTMNYGYAPIPETARLPLDPADESERFGIQLYEFVTRPVPLTGLRVLEVGCGRGGGASFLHRTLHPAEMTAVDFSEQAITLSKQRYPEASVTFLVGIRPSGVVTAFISAMRASGACATTRVAGVLPLLRLDAGLPP